MKILAVDDDAMSRKLLSRVLKRLGHEVAEAEDGASALAKFTKEPVQLVVTDWMMPGMTGLELTKRLRANTRAPYAYVVVLTSVEGRQNWLKAMEAGVDDFLAKPVDPEMLRARLSVAERILRLMAHNQTLARFIPICMYCKKARTDRDFWLDLDRYLDESGDAKLSHGVCPPCQAKHVEPMIAEYFANHPPQA